jgi:hypothetical protein
MRPALLVSVIVLAAAACATTAPAPSVAAPAPVDVAGLQRPLPYPMPESPGFRHAVANGTRTRTGRPGPKYWTQYATYSIQAELDPATKRLSGRETVRYQNRSPDTLSRVAIQLYQNLFRPGAARDEPMPVTGGLQLTKVAADGQPLPVIEGRSTLPGYDVDGTIAWLRLPRPIPPGGSARLDFAWEFVVPPDGATREGTDGEVFYIAYWYPQLAVYDDVNGWQTDQYLATAEFYMDYADYDVTLTVPAGWLVGATGELANAEQVLTAPVRARWAEARRSPVPVHVVAESERGAARATTAGENGRLAWRFRASNVRDFAWGTSDRYLWDAWHAVVGDRTGDAKPDTALVQSFYRPSRIPWAWDHSAEYARHSIEFLSGYLWPYPYPQMTAVDGVTSCTGMEYPMMTCIGGMRDTLALYSVIVHEFGHMWFPMQVGSDEKRHAWQDEGLTRFNQAQAMREYFRGYDLERLARNAYLGQARSGEEVELMRHGDLYPAGTAAYSIASYQKMATNLASLRALLGRETFERAYREYGRRWVNKHPTANDFFNAFEDVSGRKLDWFWRTWFYETWTLDQTVADVRAAGDSTEIVIDDHGLAPMPVRLAITREGGAVQRAEIPVDVWLRGARRTSIRVASTPRIVKVEIDPEEAFPDIDRGNNEWPEKER